MLCRRLVREGLLEVVAVSAVPLRRREPRAGRAGDGYRVHRARVPARRERRSLGHRGAPRRPAPRRGQGRAPDSARPRRACARCSVRRHRADRHPSGRPGLRGLRRPARRRGWRPPSWPRPRCCSTSTSTALGAGESPGLVATDEPFVCVCTHGRHDACCAELGRPTVAALTASHPEQAWEVSHIGGDRFAANVLVLPEGLYYGRVTPEDAPALVDRHLSGHLDLDLLRGRSGLPFAVQVAEVAARRAAGATGLHDLRVVSRGPAGRPVPRARRGRRHGVRRRGAAYDGGGAAAHLPGRPRQRRAGARGPSTFRPASPGRPSDRSIIDAVSSRLNRK